MLRPGVGHVEMNLAKALFKLLWTPLLRHVAALGFRSPRSMAFIQGCGDNHITWQIIRAVTDSIIKELLVPYVRDCLNKREVPSVERYLAWASRVKNNNYHMLLKFANLLVAFCLMRSGVRKNNCSANQQPACPFRSSVGRALDSR